MFPIQGSAQIGKIILRVDDAAPAARAVSGRIAVGVLLVRDRVVGPGRQGTPHREQVAGIGGEVHRQATILKMIVEINGRVLVKIAGRYPLRTAAVDPMHVARQRIMRSIQAV